MTCTPKQLESARRYRQSERGQAYMRAYEATPKAKESKRRRDVQRRTAMNTLTASIKLANGCTDCGYRGHPAALDFDHIPGRGPKLFQIGSTQLRSRESIMAEIAKCEVVCANCHRIRTYQRTHSQ